MANKNPSPATRFKPGNPGGGRPKGLLRKDDVQAVMGRFAGMTREELQGVVQDPASTMLEITIAAIFVKAAKDGDYNRMAFLLDRTIGKVKEEISIETSEKLVLPTIEEAREMLARDYATLPAAPVKVEDL